MRSPPPRGSPNEGPARGRRGSIHRWPVTPATPRHTRSLPWADGSCRLARGADMTAVIQIPVLVRARLRMAQRIESDRLPGDHEIKYVVMTHADQCGRGQRLVLLIVDPLAR